jgi:hypothetical protein
MPWYSFTTVWPDGRSSLADALRLPNDDQARHHARRIVQELRQFPDYDEPGLEIVVLDNEGDTIDRFSF